MKSFERRREFYEKLIKRAHLLTFYLRKYDKTRKKYFIYKLRKFQNEI